MATQNEDRSVLKRFAMSGVLAAASAGIALLATTKPERLREAIDRLSGRARDLAGDLGQQDLIGDLRERAESVVTATGSPAGGEHSQKNELEARRRERKKRRERRRQQMTK
jgi:hypothetical protein